LQAWFKLVCAELAELQEKIKTIDQFLHFTFERVESFKLFREITSVVRSSEVEEAGDQGDELQTKIAA
jgi:hypothetical protein